MGAGIHQWTVYIQEGRVGVAQLDDLYDYQNLYIVERFGQDYDSKTRAYAAAYELVVKSGLQLKRDGQEQD